MLEYVPETVYRVARHFTKAKLNIPIIYVKVGRLAGCGGPTHQVRRSRQTLPSFPSLRWSLEASRALPLSLHPQRWSSPKAGHPRPRPDAVREAG